MAERFRAVYTVEFDTDWQPVTDDDVDYAIEQLMEQSPGSFEIEHGGECSYFEAVGWKVEHPDWGDMSVGTMQTADESSAAAPRDEQSAAPPTDPAEAFYGLPASPDADHDLAIPSATVGGPSTAKTVSCSCGWKAVGRWNPLSEAIQRHLREVEYARERQEKAVTVP